MPLLALIFTWALAATVAPPAGAQPPSESQLLSRTRDIPGLVQRGELKADQIPNPHWRDSACQACHAGNPNAKPVRLIANDIARVCKNCHDARFDHSYIHPVDVAPGPDMIARMPGAYRAAVKRNGGALSCDTCHELPAQCLQQRRRERGYNPGFLRGGPFRARSGQCYLCHDKRAYPRLNAHEQITANGEIRKLSCNLCHTESIDAPLSNQGRGPLQFASSRDPLTLCTRCHTYKPHPGGSFGFSGKQGANHLVVPKGDYVQKMQVSAEQTGVHLPLDTASGRIACWTCHQPHPPGVIEGQGTIGQAPAKNRLRAKELCLRCHPL